MKGNTIKDLFIFFHSSGILAIGGGMVIFSHDDWLWKSFCLFCCGFVAICSLDDWEVLYSYLL